MQFSSSAHLSSAARRDEATNNRKSFCALVLWNRTKAPTTCTAASTIEQELQGNKEKKKHDRYGAQYVLPSKLCRNEGTEPT